MAGTHHTSHLIIQQQHVGTDPIITSEMDMGWVHPWVGLGWTGSTT